ncbi:hypothetical protein BDV12DRAFT_54699 [Aspergillus spectabilis]
MDVSLPVLDHVQNLKIIGNVSSLSLPKLATIARLGDTYSTGLKLGLYGTPVVVDLPKLSTVERGAYFQGNITSLSLPALRDYPEEFGVRTSESLEVNLPAGSGGLISLLGKIESAQFPNLTNFDELIVQSDIRFDCGSLLNSLKETAKDVEVEKDENVFCSGGAGILHSGFRATVAAAGFVALVGYLL